MKKFKSLREKVTLHPLMSFLFLTALVILVSGVLDFFDASVTYNKINPKTGTYETTLVTVESLLNLSGLKYIFSNTVSNFVSFAPLSMLLIVLIGVGIMDKSGFLDTMFFTLTKNVKKSAITFVFTLLCILSTITGDISFIVFIPLGALLFKYGKRNPEVGIILAFAAIGLGHGINVFISSIDSSLIEYTELAAKMIITPYSVNSNAYLFIMFPVTLIAAFIFTYVTEKIVAPKIGKYENPDEQVIEEEDKEKLTRREKRGLLFALVGAIVYILIIVYNIIPNVPFGGNLLDYTQVRYIDKLFGYESFFNNGFVFVITMLFFICGLLYGLGSKKINNHRELCNFLAHSLDGIGKVIVLLFFASTFISLLKYTNIGSLLTAALANLIDGSPITGVPLILVVLLISFITTLFLPSFNSRWQILSGPVVHLMLTAGFSAEFAQLVFNAGSSLAYITTPVMAYYVIYISYLEKYDVNGVGVMRSIKNLIPYVIATAAMWVVILILWYLIGIPLGIGTSSVL